MASDSEIEQLKKLLRHEVSLFCRHSDRHWKKAISLTVDEIREHNWQAVFFGGTLRSLLLSRISSNRIGRPRDIDIVVRDAPITDIHAHFEKYVSRKTRFGGLHLCRREWHFDVWPLRETFAFRQQGIQHPAFSDLPASTFFNLEAVAVDVWAHPGMPRNIYSGDDQFFRGLIDRVIEINREENPFPELCVVRTVALAGNLQWKIGPRLLRYLARVGASMAEGDFEKIQKKHYGAVQWAGGIFAQAIESASRKMDEGTNDGGFLCLPQQLTFWPDPDRIWPPFLAHYGNRRTAKSGNGIGH